MKEWRLALIVAAAIWAVVIGTSVIVGLVTPGPSNYNEPRPCRWSTAEQREVCR